MLKFIVSSVLYGCVIAILLLVLIPELRVGNGLTLNFLDSNTSLPPAQSFSRAVSAAAPAVVNIYSTSIETDSRYAMNRRERESLGSGVIMSEKGYILTNYHVVKDADQIRVVVQDGRVLFGELIGTDPLTDLAVLRVDAQNLPVIPQQANLHPTVGDIVLAIGNPYNIGQTITQGIISRTGRGGLTSGYLDFIQMDATINKGNSGGALVDSNGVLVGINSANFKFDPDRDIPGIYFAVPYGLAHKIMQELIKNGRVIRGHLGITGQDAALSPDGMASNLYGITVTGLTVGAPAMQAGIQVGDTIIEINGTKITGTFQGLDYVAETAPGTTLTFTLIRQSKVIELPVVIGELQLPNSAN